MNEDDMNEPRGDDAAFLDGEAGDAVRDAIRSDPVPPLDELTRRRLVSRALDEHVVGPPRRGRGPWLLGAAAAALLVLVGTTVVLADRAGDGTDSDRAGEGGVATEERDEPAAAPTEADGGAREEEFAEDSQSGGGGGGIGDVGSFDDPDELLAAAGEAARAAGLDVAPASTNRQSLVAGPCGDAFDRAEPGLTPVGFGSATYRGGEATVIVGDRPNGQRAVVVVTADCEVFADPL